MERKRIHDLGELVEAATRALTKALADGDEQHAPGSWREEAPGNHINHAQKHLIAINSPILTDVEDHLSHLVCRAVMLYARREQDELDKLAEKVMLS